MSTSGASLLLSCDGAGRIQSASPSFLTLTGLDATVLSASSVDDLGPGLPWAAARAGERLIDIRTADGEVASFEVEMIPMVESSIRASVAPEVVMVLRAAESRGRASDRIGVALSMREQQILDFVADGYRVATIARNLFISPSTVRNHLSAIFRKLGVANQAELAEKLRTT